MLTMSVSNFDTSATLAVECRHFQHQPQKTEASR